MEDGETSPHFSPHFYENKGKNHPVYIQKSGDKRENILYNDIGEKWQRRELLQPLLCSHRYQSFSVGLSAKIEAVTEKPLVEFSTDSYCYEAVPWAVESDIPKGISATKLSPNENCNRAQIAAFIWRAMDNNDICSTACTVVCPEFS